MDFVLELLYFPPFIVFSPLEVRQSKLVTREISVTMACAVEHPKELCMKTLQGDSDKTGGRRDLQLWAGNPCLVSGVWEVLHPAASS